MDILTPEVIAQKTAHIDGTANNVAINALFIGQDNSEHGLTLQAVKNVAAMERHYTGYTYAAMFADEISDLVDINEIFKGVNYAV